MRPTRLELAGFGSWVDPTVIDFTGADLFALTGDTGAGKSTVLDAISFALYGKAPRHGKKDVEPLINRGTNEARVRLDFLLDGRPLVVTRVLRRVKGGGATTREARLERPVLTADGEQDTETIEDGAKDVTAAVERLIGLTWEHFTTAVILPQGRFQEFLLAASGERQELLKELLRLGVFASVKQLAGQRAKEHQALQEATEAQLEGLRDATADAVAAAEERLAALGELAVTRARIVEQIVELREEVQAARAERDRLRRQLDVLEAVALPDGLDELSSELARAREAARAATEALDAADRERGAAVAARAELPETGAVRALAESLDDLDRRHADLEPASETAKRARADAESVAGELDQAVQQRDAARLQLENTMRHDHAAAAATGLEPGDPCPVCGRDLEAAPTVAAGDVAADRAAVNAADEQVRNLEGTLRTALDRAARAETAADALRKELDASRARTTKRAAELRLEPDPTAVAAALAACEASDRRVAEAEQAVATARDAHRGASQREAAAADAIASLDDELKSIRARITSLDLEPPTDEVEAALGERWRSLVAWCGSRRSDLAEQIEKVDRQAAELTARGTRLREEFVAQAEVAGVRIETSSRTFDEVTTAHARQEAHLEQLRANVENATRLRRAARDHRAQRELATALAETLRANKLEQWLLRRVLRQLVAHASTVFHELSAGSYSLRVSDGTSIEVVDHNNANLSRSVQSLSGGETFLASLSLALALAEEVAHLATDGAARLDALFIDEGFGTLDAETLDTVAAALQALGESGRMIGVVTHVRDLADQLPLRFEVTKVGAASRCRRSDDLGAAS
ncbi:MAG: SMC family ATPase [Nitriliruptorales bacterium]|nr:SMC family ATPase [Nitriliruptorales bacterium]